MKKLFSPIIILFFLTGITLSADYLTPIDNPVYIFLNTCQNYRISENYSTLYPLYRNEIIEELCYIKTNNYSSEYRDLAEYFINNFAFEMDKSFKTAFYPIRKIPNSFLSIFSSSSKKKLVTFSNSKSRLFISGMLGFDLDFHNSNSKMKQRLLKYYGIEIAGEISENIGLYSIFKKGHYTGNPYFTQNDSSLFIGYNWDYVERQYIETECRIRTNLADLCFGVGNFQVGKSETRSVIFSKNISAIPYIKLYKQFGKIEYSSIYAQLFQDTVHISKDKTTKSYAQQMLSWKDEKLYIAIGQNVVYGDRNFDISYNTPLVFFKLIDFNNRGRDNVGFFLSFSYIPFKGILIYNNLFIDHVSLSILTTDKKLSGLANQTGLSYSLFSLPINLTFESTIIGPWTYYHFRGLTYTSRDQILGFSEGSNLLNITFNISYINQELIFRMQYNNLQQGSIGDDPLDSDFGGPYSKFLDGNLRRIQTISTSLFFFITPHLNLHLQYVYENKDDEVKNFLYSGIELKF